MPFLATNSLQVAAVHPPVDEVPLKLGTLVQSRRVPTWGAGIILETAGGKAKVHFTDGGVRLLSLDQADLEELMESEVPADAAIRTELGRRRLSSHQAVSTRIIDLVDRFNSVFPNKFDGVFDREERDYKLAAKARLHDRLDPLELRRLLAAGQATEVMQRAFQVIGATNLVHRIEMLKFRDVSTGAAPTVAEALCDLLEAEDDKLPAALEAFGRALDPWDAAKWPIVTYFPFLQRPDRMPFVKPVPVQQAAQALGYDIGYTVVPSAAAYRRVMGLHDLVGKEMAKHSLHARDLIDVQTFLWYGCGLGTEHAARGNAQRI